MLHHVFAHRRSCRNQARSLVVDSRCDTFSFRLLYKLVQNLLTTTLQKHDTTASFNVSKIPLSFAKN